MVKRKNKSNNVVNLDKVRNKKKKIKCTYLGWEILHHKFLYYEGAKHKLKPISDEQYDKIEDEYKGLCEELGFEPTASNMVGFDYSKGSCKMIAQHMIATKGKIPRTVNVVRKEAKEVIKKVNVFFEILKEVLEEVDLDERTQKKIRVKIKKRFKV